MRLLPITACLLVCASEVLMNLFQNKAELAAKPTAQFKNNRRLIVLPSISSVSL